MIRQGNRKLFVEFPIKWKLITTVFFFIKNFLRKIPWIPLLLSEINPLSIFLLTIAECKPQWLTPDLTRPLEEEQLDPGHLWNCGKNIQRSIRVDGHLSSTDDATVGKISVLKSVQQELVQNWIQIR